MSLFVKYCVHVKQKSNKRDNEIDFSLVLKTVLGSFAQSYVNASEVDACSSRQSGKIMPRVIVVILS